MIVSYVSRAVKRFHQKGDASLIQPEHVAVVREILSILDVAEDEFDLMGLSLYDPHPYKGKYNGYSGLMSMKVRADWRVLFRFTGDGNVELVDYCDPHRGHH